MTSVLYSNKTLKTSKMNDIIILTKRDKLTDHRLLLVEKIIPHQKGPPKFRKWTKTDLLDRDRDWPV